jgi:hypothetical protein
MPLSTRRTAAPSLSSNERATLKALLGQQSVTHYPYYSSVIFRAMRSEEKGPNGSYMYEFPRGEKRRAFSYEREKTWDSGGATDAIDGRATLCETNITKANETIAGHMVDIEGLAVLVKPAVTDGLRFVQARLLAMIATNVSMQLGVNGDSNMFPLGTLQHVPCAGGLFGSGNDDLSFCDLAYGTQPLAERHGRDMPFVSNGWPTRSNHYRLPTKLTWNPAGKEDSQLNVLFTTEREFTLYTGGDPDRAQAFDSSGELIFAPESIAVVLTVHLIGTVYSARSKTA